MHREKILTYKNLRSQTFKENLTNWKAVITKDSQRSYKGFGNYKGEREEKEDHILFLLHKIIRSH